MIDFRYHLVSLMAVLIALTLGVVLGAGPLQGKISDSISGEVKRLSDKQVSLQKEKDSLIIELKADKQYLDAFVDRSTKGLLKDKKVALVTLGTVPETAVKNQIHVIENSGGQVVSQAELQNGWTIPQGQNYRQSLVGAIKEKLDHTLLIEGDTDQYIMATGLTQAITDTSEKSGAIKELLTKPFKVENQDYSLVKMDHNPTAKADAIVILSYPNSKDNKQKQPDSKEVDYSETTLNALASAFTAKQGRAVVFVGASEKDDDLISRIRALKLKVSTVDNVTNPISTSIVVMALKDNFGGKTGAYGMGDNDTVILPSVNTSE